jgi:hypothetical protein
MSTLARAWDAFMQAVEDARALTASGAEPHAIADLVRYARDLFDIIEAEIAIHPIAIPGAAGAVLAQLRGRLQSLEKDVRIRARALV